MYDGAMRLGRPVTMLVWLLGGSTALAAEMPARLVYERDAAAPGCPDEGVLRAEVAKRIGFDPFTDDAPRTIVCRVARLGHGLRARIEVGADGDRPRATRELFSKQDDCHELAEAVVVALSIAINPLVSPTRADGVPPVPTASPRSAPVEPAATRAAVADVPVRSAATGLPTQAPQVAAGATPPPLPTAEPSRTPVPSLDRRVDVLSASAPPVVVTDHASRRAIHLRLGAASAVAVGLDPGIGYGGEVDVGLVGRRYAGEIGLRALLPSSLNVGQGAIRVWQWEILVAPCMHSRHLSACLLGSAGMIRGSGQGFLLDGQAQGPRIAAGARTAVEYPLAGTRWRLRAALDLTAALTRTHFTVGGVEAWVSPRVAAALGLGLAGDFF
jgi:hypothetical protein